MHAHAHVWGSHRQCADALCHDRRRVRVCGWTRLEDTHDTPQVGVLPEHRRRARRLADRARPLAALSGHLEERVEIEGNEALAPDVARGAAHARRAERVPEGHAGAHRRAVAVAVFPAAWAAMHPWESQRCSAGLGRKK